ncbi:MAG TPA: hypothetical protein VHL57_02110, partial [Flavobacteriales bacterium]|nr:hypothetical protein [Flavobacteriales bacterium]
MPNTLLLITMCLALGAQAQSLYRPFPESNAGWVETHSWLQPGGTFDYVYNTSTRTIRFGPDTVIGNTTYHQLFSRGQGTWQTTSIPMQYGTFTEADHLFLPFRQDTVARTVYAYDVNAQQEVLWFDFNIGLGPYPDTYDNIAGSDLEVVALDSMQLMDGYHRTWVLGLVYQTQIQDSAFCTVIEGVGSTFGLHTVVGLVPPFEWNDMLLC